MYDYLLNLENKTMEELRLELNSLKIDAKSIGLNIDDCQRPTSELCQVIGLIPNTVDTIFLRASSPGSLANDRLTAIMKAINSASGIDLRSNNFGNKRPYDVVKTLKATSENVLILNLRSNNFGSPRCTEFAVMLDAIQESVIYLCLSVNRLGYKTTPELILAFNSLKESLKTLDLSGNFFDTKTVKELTELCAALPKGLERLILRSNGFKSSADLITALAVLPSVVKVDLSGNELSLSALEEIYASHPNLKESINIKSTPNSGRPLQFFAKNDTTSQDSTVVKDPIAQP